MFRRVGLAVRTWDRAKSLLLFDISRCSTVPRLMNPCSAESMEHLAAPTGLTAELNPKRLALLHELVPGARRVALLLEPAFAPMEHVALRKPRAATSTSQSRWST